MMLFLVIILVFAVIGSRVNEKETEVFRASVLQSMEEMKQIQLAPVRAKEKADREAAFVLWNDEVVEKIQTEYYGALMEDFLDGDPENFREEFEKGMTPEQTAYWAHREMYGLSEEEKAEINRPRIIYVTPRPRNAKL